MSGSRAARCAVLVAGFLALVIGLLALRGYSLGGATLGGSFRDLDWDHVDWNNHLWNLWDSRRWFLGEGALSHTANEFFPLGQRTIASQGDLVLKVLGGLLALGLSPDGTWLALALLVFVGNGVSGFVLVRGLGGSRAAGVLAGVAFCLGGVAAWAVNTGNLEYGLWLWLCLYLVSLHRLLETGGIRPMLLASLFAVLTILSNYVFAPHLALSGLLFVIVRIVRDRGLSRRRALALVGHVLLLGLLLLPAALAFRQGTAEQGLAYAPKAGATLDERTEVPYTNRARLADYLPGPRERRQDDAAPLCMVLGLALVALVRRPRQSLPWLSLSALFFVLSLGPYAETSDGTVIPLPFALLHEGLPLYHYIRFPHRVSAFIMLGLGVAAALGADALIERARGQTSRRLLTAALIGLTLLEASLAWPLKVTPKLPVNPFYRAIGTDGESYALVALPLDFGVADSRHLFYQMYHNKPIFNGCMPRYLGPEAIPVMPILRSNVLLRTAYALQSPLLARQELSKYLLLELPLAQHPPDPAQLRRGAYDLARLGFRFLVVHLRLDFDAQHTLRLPEDSRLVRTLRSALGDPVYSDDELRVFSLGPASGSTGKEGEGRSGMDGVQ